MSLASEKGNLNLKKPPKHETTVSMTAVDFDEKNMKIKKQKKKNTIDLVSMSHGCMMNTKKSL